MRPNARPARTVTAIAPVPFTDFSSSFTGQAVLVVGASLFVAIAAHLSVPLPFTPVPLTMGNLAVLLVGLALRPRAAFAALTLYLAEGAAGLPVFSNVGVPGMAHLIGPTGGYLLAYPFAAALVGWLAATLKRHVPVFIAGAVAAAAATSVIMTLGTAWLGVFSHLTPASALMLGLVPFVPGELVKIVCAAGLFRTFRGRQL